MAEWSNAAVSKTVEAKPPGVRIPLSPLNFISLGYYYSVVRYIKYKEKSLKYLERFMVVNVDF